MRTPPPLGPKRSVWWGRAPHATMGTAASHPCTLLGDGENRGPLPECRPDEPPPVPGARQHILSL